MSRSREEEIPDQSCQMQMTTEPSLSRAECIHHFAPPKGLFQLSVLYNRRSEIHPLSRNII